MEIEIGSLKRQRPVSSRCRKNPVTNGRLSSSLLQVLIFFLAFNWHYCPCDALSLKQTAVMFSANGNGSTIKTNVSNAEGKNPIFSVGMIADIQYAPIPDGASYSGTPRYYRHSLEATKHAFETFRDYQSPGSKSGDSQDKDGVDFVINLGDIIDGKCQEIEMNGGCLPSPKSTDDEDLWKSLLDHPGMLSLLEIKNAMKPYLEGKTRKVLHSYGNHCLYNLNRTELRETLGIPFRVEHPLRGLGSFSRSRQEDLMQRKKGHTEDGDDDGDLVGYYSYSFPPSQLTYNSSNANDTSNSNINHLPSVKFIVLDGYDIALMRRSPEFSQKRKHAVEILQTQNGKNFAEGNENSPEGLEGLQKRFVAFNGAIGSTQLEWLRDELEQTRQENANGGQQRVIILSHQPIHPGSSNPICLIWNYNDVLEILREYSDVVVASFSGHAHKGGYVLDDASGIHFRVIEAVLESKPPTKTFGILDVYSDRLELHGHGDCKSAVYHFDGGINFDSEAASNDSEESALCDTQEPIFNTG